MASIFDPKKQGLLGMILSQQENAARKTILGEASHSRPSTLGSIFGSSPTPSNRGAAVDWFTQALKKRKAYFAFHYDDVMRVNNVRNAWKIDHPDSALVRSFQDSSLWESKKLEGDDALKRLIRDGVEYSSAVCVLIGTETWNRRWVKYEIARSVIDQKGLLAVHINGLNHHERRCADVLGINPLHYIGVGKLQSGKLILFEKVVRSNQWTGMREWVWLPYKDYMSPVPLPKYLSEPFVNYVNPLSMGSMEYDFCAQQGHKQIGAWIDRAAITVGR